MPTLNNYKFSVYFRYMGSEYSRHTLIQAEAFSLFTHTRAEETLVSDGDENVEGSNIKACARMLRRPSAASNEGKYLSGHRNKH